MIRVAVNRGASGIDGTVSTAAGFAAGLEKITTALVGDLALLHDLNSLALVAMSKTPTCLITVNNDGGGIFSFLPISKVTGYFERYFATPHGLTFGPVAKMYGIAYRLASTIAQFETAYSDFLKRRAPVIIEVTVNRQANYDEHQKIWSEIERELDR
jgi:2-succinyl-5-enolpyruvyl-6-hydroxy-3-cyclohexene-1-carboxylate synthase